MARCCISIATRSNSDIAGTTANLTWAADGTGAWARARPLRTIQSKVVFRFGVRRRRPGRALARRRACRQWRPKARAKVLMFDRPRPRNWMARTTCRARRSASQGRGTSSPLGWNLSRARSTATPSCANGIALRGR
jgi:hypothetical protein